MDSHLPLSPPERRAVHEGKAITSGDKRWNVALWPLRVNDAFLVEQVVDSLAIKQDNDCPCAELEGVDPAISFAPFF